VLLSYLIAVAIGNDRLIIMAVWLGRKEVKEEGCCDLLFQYASHCCLTSEARREYPGAPLQLQATSIPVTDYPIGKTSNQNPREAFSASVTSDGIV